MAAVALFVGVGSISAQTSFKAEIPFDFTVGKTAMPAGEYSFSISQPGGAPTISVRNADGETSSVVLTNWFSPANKSKASELKFVKMDGVYYLYQLYVAGRDLGQQIRKVRKPGDEVATRRIDLKPEGTE